MICLAASAVLLITSLLAPGGETVAEAMKLMAAKDYDGARRILEVVVSGDGSNAEACYQLGRLLASHYRDFDAAEEVLEKALERADGDAGYHFLLGTVYGRLAQSAGILSKFSYAKKTRNQFERAVELQPDSVRYRSALFQYYLQAPGIVGGGVDKARAQAQEILKRSAFDGHMSLAQVANSESDFENAEKEYMLALAASPFDGRPHHMLGYLYLRMIRVDDAVAQFKEYTRLSPNDPNSYDSLAEGYVAKGNADEALKCYLRALSIDPHFAPSLYGAGSCYDAKGMKTEALQHFRQYVAENPKGQYADNARERIEKLSE